MCGRFTLNARLAEIAEQFRIEYINDRQRSLFEDRYNIPPTLEIPVVRLNAESAKRELLPMRWGLLPSWTKDIKKAPLLNNARSETVAEKPSFRNAFKHRRCIVPASGFFEWHTVGKDKQPYYFHPTHQPLFGYAGLWETWKGTDDEGVDKVIQSCTIITTGPNALMEPIHDRLPVILGVNDYAPWLDPAATDLQYLLTPCPPDEMTCYPVDKYVNNIRNQGPKCIEPIERQLNLLLD